MLLVTDRMEGQFSGLNFLVSSYARKCIIFQTCWFGKLPTSMFNLSDCASEAEAENNSKEN